MALRQVRLPARGRAVKRRVLGWEEDLDYGLAWSGREQAKCCIGCGSRFPGSQVAIKVAFYADLMSLFDIVVHREGDGPLAHCRRCGTRYDIQQPPRSESRTHWWDPR
jgi:hypothetical protein